ncbi:MAG: glycosyltransferase family 4 protein [Chloroflexia bacterium]
MIPGFQSDAEDWCIPVFTNLARELAEQIELHIFALRYPQRRDHYTIGKVHVHSIGAGAVGRFRLFGVSLGKLWTDFFVTIEQVHTSTPFDAIVGIWATESGWLAVQAAKRLGLKSLVHLAGGEVVTLPYIQYGNRSDAVAGTLVKDSLTNADLITVPSETMERALHRMPGIDKESVLSRVRPWAPGVDTEMFSPLVQEVSRAAERFTFVNVGSLLQVKGQRLLIRAMGRLRNRMKSDFNVYLRIVGTGPLLRDLQLEVEYQKLKGYVTFEGEVTHDRLPEVYRNADAFLLGSHHEAQCMALIEAMSSGLPWVAPKVGVVPNVARIDSGETPSGMTFDSRDPGLVASAMQAMVALPLDERRRYGIQARNKVLRSYEMKTQAERLVAIVAELTLQ